MDAGWTRFIFDSYHIPYTVIRPAELKDLDQFNEYDLLIFPDSRKSILLSGKWKSEDSYYVSNYPPEYTKGMTDQGKQNIFKFINSGGQVISWGQSTALFDGMQKIEHSKSNIEEFQLPVNDVSDKLRKEGLYCPGSLVEINLLPDHPLTLGMQERIGVFYRGRPAFTTSIPGFDMDRRVIARFPEENILLSGYCENEELLAEKTALTWLKKGKGNVILFAFNPQFRASTPASYKLLFNAILLGEQ
jgi:hypothetical protein